MSPLEQLQDFLTAHFTAGELRQLIAYLPSSRLLTDGLPGESVSLRELTFAAVQALHRNGGLDAAFWARLREERPHLVGEITAIEAGQWVSRSATPAGLSLVMARATQHRDHAEVEFILHNEATAPQFITEISLEAKRLVVDYTPGLGLQFHEYFDGFRVLLKNTGWSNIEIEGSAFVRWIGPNLRVQKIPACRVASGAEAELARIAKPVMFGPAYGTAAVQISGRYRATQIGTWHPLNRRIYSPRPAASYIDESRVWTTYICLFDTAESTSQRRYRVVRAIPAGQADIFACIVSADRSAAFDLLVEVTTASGTVLSSRHEGLFVVRRPNDPWNIKNGDEFTLGPGGVWNIVKKPWQRSL